MSFPIVGAHFRPPAKAILQCLPLGHPVWARREPENEYDSNAIKIVVYSETIRDLPKEVTDTLNTLGMGQGYDLEAILEEPEWHLGYIPKAMTSLVHPAFGEAEEEASSNYEINSEEALQSLANIELAGALHSTSTGAPSIEFEAPSLKKGV